MKDLAEMTECPICVAIFHKPKNLPCVHSFCLSCLEKYCETKLPGETMPCPVCRAEFMIPKGGMSKWPNNFFLQKLCEVVTSTEVDEAAKMPPPPCNVCSSLDSGKDAKTLASVRCVECEQDLCEGCAQRHKLMTCTKSHQLKRLVSIEKRSPTSTSWSFDEADCAETAVSRCKVHPKKEKDVYCLNCEVDICATCFITKHKNHDCSDIEEVVEGTKQQVRVGMSSVEGLLRTDGDRISEVHEQMEKVVTNVEQIGTEIIKKGEEIKRVVENNVKTLLEELYQYKLAKLKECDTTQQELSAHKLACETFLRFSTEVLGRLNPSNLVRSSKDLSERIKKLQRRSMVIDDSPCGVSFMPTDMKNLLKSNMDNIVGNISSKFTFYC